MTNDQIIEMARQAGLDREEQDNRCRSEYWTATIDELQAFAQLVRNATLEEAAKDVEEWGFNETEPYRIAASIRSLKS